jgi:hypothetical protein
LFSISSDYFYLVSVSYCSLSLLYDLFINNGVYSTFF